MANERLELIPDTHWTDPGIDEYWFNIRAKDPERLKEVFDWLSDRYGKSRSYGPDRTFGYFVHRHLLEELRWDHTGELINMGVDDQGIDGYTLGIMLSEQQAVELKLVFDELFND